MEVKSRETIKPSSPTPPHLRILPLSCLDHILPHCYVPLLLFYENKALESEPNLVNETSEILRKSLSHVLSMYYPFAGRLRDPHSIECNDEGVAFSVTHFTTCKLSEMLENPMQESLDSLFMDQLQWKMGETSGSLIAIQVNHFACGGTAIGVCMSHKLADAFTLFCFLNDWATITRRFTNFEEQDQQVIILPQFNGASIFPPGDVPIPEVDARMPNDFISTLRKRRFVFEASKVKSLKAMVSKKVQNPTRVQVVSALVYKCMVSALRSSSTSAKLATRFCISMNIRSRMSPRPPEKSLGNMSFDFHVSTTNPAIEVQNLHLHELVRKMRQCVSEFADTHARELERKDMSYFVEYLKSPLALTTNVNVSSWCRFPMYETDFGWGKPVWVTTVPFHLKNVALIMDARDGEGIEVCVTLEEQAMEAFECSEELLQYASLLN